MAANPPSFTEEQLQTCVLVLEEIKRRPELLSQKRFKPVKSAVRKICDDLEKV
jgi:hypothetical protein